MLLTDLIELRVRDEHGRPLGRVIDVRFVLNGEFDGVLAQARLSGFLVGSHTHSAYRGYERLDMTGPLPIARFIRWRHRGTFLVLWSDVAVIDADGIVLVRHFTRYDPSLRGRSD